ncbi:MAG: site-specific integrase [Chloroflexi bacterium]|nr:site-specific integrase [Chloroflexota bacterium]
MLDAYLLDRDGKVIDHKELSRTVGKLKAHFGNLKPHHLNKMVVANYTRARMETVQGSTVRGELLILRAAFKWGTPEWVRVNPTIETPPAGLPRERWLTRSEAARLLWGAKAHHMRLFIRLALYTTARTGAILGLTWDRVDFERRTIDYRDPRRKMTSKRRVPVPIGRRLYRALKQAHRIRRTSYVVEYGGKGLKDVAGGFSMACARAGLEGVTPHTLRHTGATWMAQKGRSMFEVAGMLGQNPMTTSRVYAKQSPEHLRDAVDALEK